MSADIKRLLHSVLVEDVTEWHESTRLVLADAMEEAGDDRHFSIRKFFPPGDGLQLPGSQDDVLVELCITNRSATHDTFVKLTPANGADARFIGSIAPRAFWKYQPNFGRPLFPDVAGAWINFSPLLRDVTIEAEIGHRVLRYGGVGCWSWYVCRCVRQAAWAAYRNVVLDLLPELTDGRRAEGGWLEYETAIAIPR